MRLGILGFCTALVAIGWAQSTISGNVRLSGAMTIPKAHTVDLTWTDSDTGITFKIYRGTSSGAETLLASGITATAYTDKTVRNGTTYYYYVTAFRTSDSAESGPSNESSAIIPSD